MIVPCTFEFNMVTRKKPKKFGFASQMIQKTNMEVVGASKEGSIQNRRMVEKGTDVRRSGLQGRRSKTLYENSQATISEDIRPLPVEEHGQVGCGS